MENMKYSKHALIRSQQRGKSEEVTQFIINYGKSVNTHGDRKSFVPNKLFKKLMLDKEHINFLKKNDKQIKSTAVIWNEKDKTIITTFTITKRNNWNN